MIFIVLINLYQFLIKLELTRHTDNKRNTERRDQDILITLDCKLQKFKEKKTKKFKI